jgi:CspA family cold shock protein
MSSPATEQAADCLVYGPGRAHNACVDLCRVTLLSPLAQRAELSKPTLSDLDGPPGFSGEPTHLSEAVMATGTVKWFNSTKGFGFIQPADGGKDVFVHISAVERSDLNGLNEGDTVSYEMERDQRSGKESAVNLKSA